MSRSEAPLAFFERLKESYDAAPTGESVRKIRVAGRVVELRFRSRAVHDALMPALGHLESGEPDAPEITLLAFDEISSRAKLPPTPWTLADYQTRGLIDGYNDARFRTAFPLHAYALSMFDVHERVGVFATRDISSLPITESSAPLLMLFHWALTSPHLHLAHAAAVGDARGGLLLTGRGGSGKSTTALAALTRGMLYAGDDYCLIDVSKAARAVSLFSSGKLDPWSRAHLPELAASLSPRIEAGEPKRLLLLAETHAQQLARELPLRAVAVPRVTGGERTTIAPLAPAAALRALAPSSLLQLGEREGASLPFFGGLVRELPCYEVRLGTGVDGVVGALRDLLERVH